MRRRTKNPICEKPILQHQPTNQMEELYLIAKLAAIILRCDYVDGLLCLNMQM